MSKTMMKQDKMYPGTKCPLYRQNLTLRLACDAAKHFIIITTITIIIIAITLLPCGLHVLLNTLSVNKLTKVIKLVDHLRKKTHYSWQMAQIFSPDQTQIFKYIHQIYLNSSNILTRPDLSQIFSPDLSPPWPTSRRCQISIPGLFSNLL